MAVKAGTDLDCGRSYRTLVEAVAKGFISEQEINHSVERLFAARFRLGMFDPPEQVPFSKLGMDQVQSPAHQNLALEASRKSIVLLKNEGQILPLRYRPKRIAVLGPAADDPDVLLANYNGIPAHIITPLQGIEQEFGKAKVRFALGATYVSSSMALVPQNVLAPKGGASGEHGLLAQYFGDENFSGAPVLSRVETRGYLIWDMQEPALFKTVPRQSFALRWSGSITVNQTGDYELGVVRAECHSCGRTDSARLYINDRVRIDDDSAAHESMQPKTASVHLEARKAQAIRIEYREHGGGGGLQLVWRPPAAAALAEAVAAAIDSDLAIVCVGLNARLEGEESKIQIPGFSGGDRTNIDLPDSQEKLLNAVLATGKPVIVVLVNGSALAIQSAKKSARAILEIWYPGQEGGKAIAETLSGVNNPAGRLPVTFYQSTEQLPAFDDYSMKERAYRFIKGEPLYAFGYGLSYSDFHYSDLAIKPSGNASLYEVSATVTNRSKVDGDEVVQLYLLGVGSDNPELRGLQRVHLQHGETRVMRFLVNRGEARNKAIFSVGGGQPLPAWTAGHYLQAPLPQ